MIAEENSAAANNTVNTTTQAADDKAKLTVGGFIFSSPEDAELARNELTKIEYLEKKMNYHMPENILVVYNKVLESKMLKTPLGIEYMHRMQAMMRKGGIDKERIAPIPVYTNFTAKGSGDLAEGIAKQRIERRLKKEKTESAKLKSLFHGALIACLFLSVLIGAMFYITLKSDNPNILNYENVILDRYATWEQELNERERIIREKERAFE